MMSRTLLSLVLAPVIFALPVDQSSQSLDAATEAKLDAHTAHKKEVKSSALPEECSRDVNGITVHAGFGATVGMPCTGKGACLLIEWFGILTCEIDPDHFSTKQQCEDDHGHWCEEEEPLPFGQTTPCPDWCNAYTKTNVMCKGCVTIAPIPVKPSPLCHCWANGGHNEAYCENSASAIFLNPDACDADPRCHWGPGELATCTAMLTPVTPTPVVPPTCHCFANGHHNEAYCQNPASALFLNPDACDADPRCHWGPGQLATCTDMLTAPVAAPSPVDCAAVPPTCTHVCRPFAYCLTTPDSNCANAPSWCEDYCAPYAVCLTAPKPVVPTPVVPTPVAPAPCADVPDYVEYIGKNGGTPYTCAAWVGYDCNDAECRAGEAQAACFHYTPEQQARLLDSCPLTCGECTTSKHAKQGKTMSATKRAHKRRDAQ